MSVNTTTSKSAFLRLLDTGIHDELPTHLKRRIRPTNIIGLVIFAFVGIPFSIITLIYFPPLVWYPGVGGLLCASVVLLNKQGAYDASRIIVTLIPITLGAIYNASLSAAHEDPLPSVYLLELSFSLIPLVIYDIKEKTSIFFSILVCAIIILTFPITKHWFHSTYDSTVLRSGWLSTVAILLAIATQLGCVLGLVAIGKQAENESETSRQIAESEKRKLEIEKEENIKKSEELQKNQAEEKKRQWANEGVSLISKVIRESQDDDTLYDKIVSTVVKYMNVNQGGLFLIESDSDTPKIVLRACYAYGRKKFTDKAIAPGEGLVGQAYMERQYIYLTEVPQNYVRITSGLGHATPKALIVMPLITNDMVQGIIELASFQTFEAHEIDFLEKMGEILASQINNQKVVKQTQFLLRQAQEQSEELRAQEEEMRQNMEELSATQEHAQRQMEESKSLYDQLQTRELVFGHTTILSEADLNGTITFVNDKLCQISKYSREELIGREHNIFRHHDMPSALFKRFWDTIKRGETFRGIIKNKAKDGSHYWVDATIVPIRDKGGNIEKYIGARYHITDDQIAEQMYAKQLKTFEIEV